MKILYPNRAALVDAGPAETMGSYPITNLLDGHLLKPWKAEATAQQTELLLNFEFNQSADNIALFGLDLEALTIEVYDNQATPQLVDEVVFPCQGEDSFGPVQTQQLWWSFPLQSAGSVIIRVDTTVHKNPSIGVISIGPAISYPNPNWGFHQGWSNHSIKKQLKSGSYFRRDKQIARNPQAAMELPISRGGKARYYEFLHFYQRINSNPFACLMIEGLLDDSDQSLDREYSIWGSFGENFNPTEAKYSAYHIEFNLEEGL